MNDEISVGDLARRIAALMGVRSRSIAATERERPTASEVERLVCDNSPAAASRPTGAPAHPRDAVSRDTIAWFRRERRRRAAPITMI